MHLDEQKLSCSKNGRQKGGRGSAGPPLKIGGVIHPPPLAAAQTCCRPLVEPSTIIKYCLGVCTATETSCSSDNKQQPITAAAAAAADVAAAQGWGPVLNGLPQPPCAG